jgi:hypothetical protein
MSTEFKNISLYIPHIFANYTKDMVAKAFEILNIGKINHIDFITKMSASGEYNAAYIHFDHWFDTIAARNFQSKVLDSTKEARLMYEDPWYWIVLENKARKFTPGDRKPRIVIDAPSISAVKTTPKPAPREAPNAPVKMSSNSDCNIASCKPVNLNNVFDDLEEEAQMDEIERIMEEEEQYMQNIETQYVQTLEEENNALRVELEQLRLGYYHLDIAYRNEAIKSQALATAIQLVKN